ncbi:protein phosphatase 1 regulatory subunit 14C isoform X1 [Schistocerca gregaria]|uniref:protein phosphatase 1 regulatory subunit 14C isoform X1 n=1 Tax=Schistocerca gregaria TaxID=7010 RepID=UPI00211E7EDC|nr:protein phosphatase 1 regulatory subunit 14C isoform X1 [Schistocerca gregaria]
MASKLRRAPLFTYSDTGSRCLTCYTAATATAAPGAIPKKQPAFQMECGVSAAYSAANGSSPNGIMADVRGERSPAKSGLHVHFPEKGEVKERREKFLTAKYGTHQMSLIRKRLAVEMWLYDELQKLYEPAEDESAGSSSESAVVSTAVEAQECAESIENSKTREVEVDIDELLDMDSDDQRRRHLQELLADAKKSPHDVKKFVEDLLERAKTL